LVNIFGGYRFKIKEDVLLISGSIINLLNAAYISDASNNGNGNNNNFDATSSMVMFGQGLRFNVSLAYQF
jgi:outer membrane receptor protein involved in Fe transport